MKKSIATAAAIVLAALSVQAQPAKCAGQQTGVRINVTVEKTVFTPGIYAAYAAELLGIEVGVKPETTVTITSIEAGPSSASDKVQYSETWLTPCRRPEAGIEILKDPADFIKPANAAAELRKLREDRMNIVIGNTDATYSGQALGDAVKYLTRREKEILSLFEGRTDRYRQTATYVVTPEAGVENHKYIAFRLHPDTGLHDAFEFMGDPWFVDLRPVFEEPESFEDEPENDAAKTEGKKVKAPRIKTVKMTIPGVFDVAVTDGKKTWVHFQQEFPQLTRQITVKIKVQ